MQNMQPNDCSGTQYAVSFAAEPMEMKLMNIISNRHGFLKHAAFLQFLERVMQSNRCISTRCYDGVDAVAPFDA